MNKNLLNTLKELGLSDFEASVYLATLSLGPSTVSKIASISGVKRTSVYPIIESLKQKGLMNIELKGWKKLYTAENPEKLKFILSDKINKLTDKLPDFMALYNLKGGESFVKYYEGLNGIKSVYESFLKEVKPGDDFLVISDTQKWSALDPEYFLDFTKRRARLGIKSKMLFQETLRAHEYKNKEQEFKLKVKILPAKTELITSMITTPKKVLIMQLTEPIVGIVIENKSIIQMSKQLFEIIWDSIKE